MKSFCSRRYLVAICSVFLLAQLARDAGAWTQDVIDAAYAVSSGKATPKQLAIAFQNNTAINEMARVGKLPNKVYIANQQKFDAINKTFIEKAATDAGLKANHQAKAPGSSPKAGTDTDIILTKNKGQKAPITKTQVDKVNSSYQKYVQQFLEKRGVSSRGSVDTQTDFMPHPDHTTPQEFRKINQAINKAGGTAYENPASARVEAQIRSGEKININDASQYASEMQSLANQKLNHANKLSNEAAKLPAGDPRRASLNAQAAVSRTQAAKYTERINTVGETICKQNNISPAKPTVEGPLAASVKKVNVDRTGATVGDTHVVGGMGEKAVNDSVKNFSENMARIIKDNPNAPGAKEAVNSIAEQTRNMTPSQKAEVVDSVRNTAGDKAAQDVAKAMQKTKPTKPAGATAEPVGGKAGKTETAAPKTGEVKPVGTKGATGEVKAPGATKPGTAEAGIMKSGQGGTSEVGIGSTLKGYFQKGMKVLGPLLMVKDGVERIHSVSTKTGDERAEEATQQLGGFTGGTVGATGGAIVGAKIGALAGSALGPIGTAVGGFLGGLYGGYKGYQAGAEVGEKNASGVMNWLAGNNKTQQQHNRETGIDGVADGLRDILIKNGIPAERAGSLAERIKGGDDNAMKEVHQIGLEIRERQQAQQDSGGTVAKGSDSDSSKDKIGVAGDAKAQTGRDSADAKSADKAGEQSDSQKASKSEKKGDSESKADGDSKSDSRTTDLGAQEAAPSVPDVASAGKGDQNAQGGGGIGDFSDRRTQKTTRKSDMDLSKVSSDAQQQETSSDSKIKDADRTRDSGGQDAQGVISDDAAKSASQQKGQGWGVAIGDALEQGVTQGATAIGTALGAAGAGHMISTLFPSGKKSDDGTDENASTSDDASSGGSSAGGGKSASREGKADSKGDSANAGQGGAEGAASTGGAATAGAAGAAGASPSGEDGIPEGTQVVNVSGGATGNDGTGTAGASVGGTSGSASGGQSLTPIDHTINGGSALAGRTVVGIKATVKYNSYSIPDTFQIVYNGAVIQSSGHVSGDGTLVGNAQGNSPVVVVRVLSPDVGTAWICSWSVDYFVK